ncbi:MAG: pyruvate formate-lyase 1-activating enzyme, partial [Akkermansia sp.]
RLAALRKPVWLRYVLVPGLTDDMEDMAQLARCARRLGNVERVDILPFHQMGRFKWDELDLDYTLRDVREPSAELTEQARSIFRREGISRYEVH